MSSVINNKLNENDQAIAAPPKGEKVLSKGELFSTSLGVMTMTANQMLESFGVQTQNSSNSANDDFSQDDLMTQMMLDSQTKRLEKGERMEEALIRALGTELVDPKKGKQTEGAPNSKQTNASNGKKTEETLTFAKANAPDGNKYGGKEAIFEAAGLVTQLQKNAQDSLAQQLENQMKVMEEQLLVLEKLEEFITKFVQDWDAYKKDPSDANFAALIALLKDHFAGDPDMLKLLDQLVHDRDVAKAKQKDWDGKSGFEKGWDNFWGENQDERYAMRNFNSLANTVFNSIELQVFGNQPQMYADFMKNGQKAFTDRIQSLLTEMSELLIILSILQGDSKGAIFKAEALLMNLMEAAIKNNSQKNKDQTKMADVNIQIQQQNYDKAKSDLDKIRASEHHSHGIFGWIWDFVKSVVDIVVNIVSDICTGNFKGLYNDTIGKTVDSLIDVAKDFAKGDVLQGLETLGTDVVLVTLFGPAGLLLINSSFGKDIHDAVKLAVDCVVALGAIVTAGLEYVMTGGQDMKTFQTLVDAAKTHGEAILSNPALQAVADIAMIAVIVASCISGQYWLAGIMLVLLVANDVTDSDGNSLMSDATTYLAKGIQFLYNNTIAEIPGAAKMSDDTAKMIADIVVIVIVTAVTFGAGAPEAAAEESIEDGIEMVNMSADVGVDGTSQAIKVASRVGSDAVEEAQTAAQKVMKVLRKVWEAMKSAPGKLGEAIGSQTGTAMMAGGMFMGATGFAGDFAKVVAKDNEKLQEIITILLEVVTVLATLAGGLGAMSGDMAAIDQKIGSFLKSIAPTKLAETIDANAASLAAAAPQMMTGGMITQGITTMLKGGDMILVGEIKKDLQQIQGLIAIMSSAENINQQMMKNNQSDLKKITQEEIQFVKNMDAPALASLGNARALEQLA